MLQLPMASFPELLTPHLRLRELQPRDAEAIYQIFSDAQVTKYHELERFTSIYDAHSLLESEAARYHSGEAIRWGIAQLQNDMIIGACGLKLDRENHSGSLGYELAFPYWGRGIMSEALSIVLRFCFKTLNINRLQALVVPENEPSTKLLNQLNFQREGVLRQASYFKGGFHNMVCFALLSQDWSQA